MQYSLYDCVWELTLACCFSCAHCGSRAGLSRSQELTLSEALEVVFQLETLGCQRVSLIGGEVFLYPGWEIVAEFLTRRGIRTSIITNGYLINRPLLEQVRRAGVRHISVSLDGIEAHHDAVRTIGSFRKAVEAIRLIREEGLLVSVITTLNQLNADDLPALYELFRSLNIDAWQIQNCVSMGNAVDLHAPDTDQQLSILRFTAEKAQEAPFMMGLAHNVGYFTPEETLVRGTPLGRLSFNGCHAGLSTVAIDSAGNVRGCESLYDDRFIEGNVRTRSLVDIWNDENTFSYNRRFTPDCLSGACRDCEMNEYCAGGCRSMNYFSTGSLYTSSHCVRSGGVRHPAVSE